ncbi:MAG: hypothetical protein MUC81_04920 [Bacteroidia bacterium]|jgi:hypothetical protein|nr:hypothetical protein [Bacteroidia bacterium]
MKTSLTFILLIISFHGKAQWIWRNDSLKRSDLVQFSIGFHFGTYQLISKYSNLDYIKFNGWERGFSFVTQTKLSPVISFSFNYKKLQQGIMMYYIHPDFFESFMLNSIQTSLSPTINYTILSRKKIEILSLSVGASFNKTYFTVPFAGRFNISNQYNINNTAAILINSTTYSNHSFVIGLSKGIKLGTSLSLNAFIETEYNPKFVEFKYQYFDSRTTPVYNKEVNLSFASYQSRLGVNLKW